MAWKRTFHNKTSEANTGQHKKANNNTRNYTLTTLDLREGGGREKQVKLNFFYYNNYG